MVKRRIVVKSPEMLDGCAGGRGSGRNPRRRGDELRSKTFPSILCFIIKK
jgi:hypothetical protein